jgi:hypothetical protein
MDCHSPGQRNRKCVFVELLGCRQGERVGGHGSRKRWGDVRIMGVNMNRSSSRFQNFKSKVDLYLSSPLFLIVLILAFMLM